MSLTFLLTGCVEIDVDIGIDEHYTALLSYRIALDVSVVDIQYQDVLRTALHNIGWYYQENHGFAVELQFDSDPYVLIMSRRVENRSYEQAYRSLEDMLTNEEMTLFMEIDMAFQSHERQNRYMFGAITDIPQIMRLSNVEELAPALQQQYEDAAETGKGSITLTLPTSEVINSTHQTQVRNNQAVMTVPLSFNGKTAFELSGVQNLLRDGTPAGSVDEILWEQNRFRDISILVCAAALVLFLILILVLILRRAKNRSHRGQYRSARNTDDIAY